MPQFGLPLPRALRQVESPHLLADDLRVKERFGFERHLFSGRLCRDGKKPSVLADRQNPALAPRPRPRAPGQRVVTRLDVRHRVAWSPSPPSGAQSAGRKRAVLGLYSWCTRDVTKEPRTSWARLGLGAGLRLGLGREGPGRGGHNTCLRAGGRSLKRTVMGEIRVYRWG